MPTVVLNSAYADPTYEQPVDTDDHFYELQFPASTHGHLNAKKVLYNQDGLLVPPEPPERRNRPEKLRLWPIWLAILATAAIAVAALIGSPRSDPVRAANSMESAVTQSTTTAYWTPTTTSPYVIPECLCAPGTIVFAVQDLGRCYAVANGSNGTPNLLQQGGLYVRAGLPDVAGQTLPQSTAVNGLSVHVTATLAEELPPVYDDCDGTPGHYLRQDRIRWLDPNSGGRQCPSHINTSSTVAGDQETRPPSMYLTPYMCV